jgi:hypothetical protein
LLLAVSIKTISFGPFGKNLKNRFGDLCTEAITLHMRFPYSVVCALFAFPIDADEDNMKQRQLSTFRRACKLFGTISGRGEYTGPGEKFEHVAMLLYRPMGHPDTPNIRIIDAASGEEISETLYFANLHRLFSERNPHMTIGASILNIDE